jgi:hypothetical protein
MAYPNTHLYLTAHWTQAGATIEQGQTGLRFDSPAAASQALVDACAAAWSTFWTTAVAGIEQGYQLAFLRLASIAPDGNYVPDSVAYDHVFSGVVGGGGVTANRFPLAMSMASTLLTAVPRGLANRGRMYLPWYNAPLQIGYVWQAADANNRSNPLAAMIGALNDVLPGPASVMSKKGLLGAKQPITAVMTGRRPDTQRRRQNHIPEQYGSVWNVP